MIGPPFWWRNLGEISPPKGTALFMDIFMDIIIVIVVGVRLLGDLLGPGLLEGYSC